MAVVHILQFIAWKIIGKIPEGVWGMLFIISLAVTVGSAVRTFNCWLNPDSFYSEEDEWEEDELDEDYDTEQDLY